MKKKAKPRKVRITFTATVEPWFDAFDIPHKWAQRDLADLLRDVHSEQSGYAIHTPRSIEIEELEKDR